MSDHELDELIGATARLLGLALDPEWRPTVRAELAVTLRYAALVADFRLSDDAEPAPVFQS